jgi:predicted membrane channel-forming protein YqfA (hemolysin III family)
MKYEMIKKSAIYTFIIVTVAMTLLGVIAIWFPDLDDVVGKAFATVLVVGFGCITIAYSSSLLEERPEKKEALPSFAPHPKPVPPANHVAKD